MAAEFEVIGFTEHGGKRVARRYQADNVREAQQMAKADHILPTRTTRVSEFFVKRRHGDRLPYNIQRAIHVSIGVQLDCGANVLEAVTSLGRSMTNRKARKVLGGIRAQLLSEGDKSLAGAMAAYPRVWAPNVCAMVAAGERNPKEFGGMFKQVNAYCEEMRALRNILVSELTMPAIAIVMGIGVMGLMMFFTLPRMADFFKELGVKDLPAVTRILISVGKWMQHNADVILLGVLALGAATVIAYFTGFLVKIGWGVATRTPVLREMLRMQSLARFCTVFVSIHRATKRLDTSMEYAAAALTVPRMRAAAIRITDAQKVSTTDFVVEMRQIPGFDECLLNTMAPEKARPRLPEICERFKEGYVEQAKYLGAQFAKMISLSSLFMILAMVIIAIVAYGAPMLRLMEAMGKN